MSKKTTTIVEKINEEGKIIERITTIVEDDDNTKQSEITTINNLQPIKTDAYSNKEV
jgi:hypothetical protein